MSGNRTAEGAARMRAARALIARAAAMQQRPDAFVFQAPKGNPYKTAACIDCGAQCDRRGLRCRPCMRLDRGWPEGER